ncbi:MAG: septum formation initiator family protein [Thermoanaerobacteraceae bacterium]|nr:septum formation initiator family protein [Thermoanaerobacteraceae bacterium]
MTMSNNTRKSPLKLILSVVLIVLLLIPIAPQVKNIWDLHKQIESLEKQKAELIATQEELKQELQQASSMATVEKIAREQLGMVKPGESRIIEYLP